MSITSTIWSAIEKLYYLYDYTAKWRNMEIIQNVVGTAYIVLGSFAIQNMTKEYGAKKTVLSIPSNARSQRLLKTVSILGNLSLIGSALSSKPATTAFKWVVRQLLKPDHIEVFFGPSSLLYGERLCNIVWLSSFLMGMPSTIKYTHDVYYWLYKKVIAHTRKNNQRENRFDLVLTINTIAKGAFISYHLWQRLR